MKTISKSKLKAHLLELFREVESSGEALIITDHSRPVLKITPFDEKKSIHELFTPFQGKISYSKDIWDFDAEEWGDLV